MRKVVSDAGPILHLHEIGALGLLAPAGAVRVPQRVQDELCRHIADWPGGRPPWLSIEELEPAELGRVQPWLDAGIIHPGEAAALALALKIQADWFLTDDTAGPGCWPAR